MEPPPQPSQASVVRFLSERGGRAPNAELLGHFRASLNSPESRQRFKEAVNAVATVVRQEPGSGGGGGGGSSKYVQLRKKYRNNNNDVAINGPLPSEPEEPSSSSSLRELIIKEGEGMVTRESGREEDGGEREGTVGAEAEVKGREGEKKKREAEALEEHGALTAAALTTTTPPRCGRKALRERRVLGSSPQATKRGGGTAASRDSDSASLASSSAAEEEGGGGGGSVALDPLEHAWMLSASEGRWEPLEALLGCEPSLLGKRDFVTGFSCLHWAAKLGRAELVALLVSFGRRRGLPLDVNARTAAGGYTALHLAALHGHLEVVKLLVGAYDADVELRDYSGRKAAHYLGREEEKGLRGLVGEEEEEEAGSEDSAPSGRWRLSRVLAHLHLQGDEAEEAAKGRGGELSRKGSSGGGRSSKPRLNKVRFRTQIIHNTPSFRGEAHQDGGEDEEENGERPLLKGSFKLRPKSNVFG